MWGFHQTLVPTGESLAASLGSNPTGFMKILSRLIRATFLDPRVARQAALDENGNSLCPNAPVYFFCPDGSYEIYDYRSPGELRIDAVGEALAQGHFTTGKVTHDVVGG